MLRLPTLVTWSRIILIPIFVAVFLWPAQWSQPLGSLLFGIAALSDWLDGYLARRLGQTSAFGAFLDPIADKLMVMAALVLLVYTIPPPWKLWVTLAAMIIIGREISISALREWLAHQGQSGTVAVNLAGKIKTTTQMLALLLLLYQQPIAGLPTVEIGIGLLLAATLLTLYSMGHYLWIAWFALHR